MGSCDKMGYRKNKNYIIYVSIALFCSECSIWSRCDGSTWLLAKDPRQTPVKPPHVYSREISSKYRHDL